MFPGKGVPMDSKKSIETGGSKGVVLRTGCSFSLMLSIWVFGGGGNCLALESIIGDGIKLYGCVSGISSWTCR